MRKFLRIYTYIINTENKNLIDDIVKSCLLVIC